MVGADPAEDPEHALDEERRLREPPVGEVGQGVQVADVVALVLEPGAAPLPQLPQRVLDLLEGVDEGGAVGVLDVGLLPRVLPARHLLGDAGVHEVHRPHVERGELGAEPGRRGQPLLDGHRRRPAGRDVHDRVAARDRRDDLLEDARLERGPAVLGVAGVQVDDGRARLRRGQGLGDDLRGRDREVVALRRHVHRARHRGADDHAVGLPHDGFSSSPSRNAGLSAIIRRTSFSGTPWSSSAPTR